MDVMLDDQEVLIQEAARTFLAAESSPAVVRSAENAENVNLHLWRRFADLGWLGLALPEDVGGQGLSLPYLALLFEELGRHITPLPVHSTLISALVIDRHGNAAQRELLPSVIAGDRRLSFAVAEPSGRWSEAGIRLEAKRQGERLVLNGRKSFVADFAGSSHCLVAVRLVDSPANDSPGLVLVDTAHAGIESTRLLPLARDHEYAVEFRDVEIPLDSIVGRGRAPLPELMDYAALFMACQMQGAARKAMELATHYVTEREAFGQPIGAFQAIQHMAADMLNAVDGVQLLSREAAWLLGEGLPARVEVAQAKAFANEKCLMICRCAQQMHGGIGFIADCDINLWYRNVASWALRAGTIHEHRKLIASALFDTPGKVRLAAPRLERSSPAQDLAGLAA